MGDSKALKGTSDHKLTYRSELAGSESFMTYTDASYGDCVDTGRSTAGFVTVIWRCYCTIEGEYMAAIEAGKEIDCMDEEHSC